MSRSTADLETTTAELCHELMRRCISKKLSIVVVHTHRTALEQDNLYAKGRTRPGPACTCKKPCKKHPMGLTVTNARGGMSWHNHGRAFDIAFVGNDGKVTWEGPWKAVGEIGEALGMTWGGRWKQRDMGHFEYHPNLTLRGVNKRLV